ncbi:MAG: HIT family protein [Vibrio litoralis]|uniref:HIT family protein n=1 Tax=Vibrio litoralis TaxID=335972 RepID=UPI003F97D6E6
MKDKKSIQIPKNDSCAFCAYLLGERPFSFVYKGNMVSILVTREQRGSPHMLVIPNRHVETILDVTEEEAGKLAVAVRDIAKAIESEFKPKGITIWQNNGAPSSQSIAHVHFHVAGTLKTGGTEWGDVSELPLEETEDIANKLRPLFSSYSL